VNSHLRQENLEKEKKPGVRKKSIGPRAVCTSAARRDLWIGKRREDGLKKIENARAPVTGEDRYFCRRSEREEGRGLASCP